MKLDSGIHIVMHLVFFGKTCVTVTHQLNTIFSGDQPRLFLLHD
jgi:hypothetical protein